MLNAGGGPLEVSIPLLLRDAGGLRVAGERGSRPDAAGWCSKYPPVRVDSGVDGALGDNGGDRGEVLSGLSSSIIPVVGLGFAITVKIWVVCGVASTAGDDGGVLFAKDANWPVSLVGEECVPCVSGVF